MLLRTLGQQLISSATRRAGSMRALLQQRPTSTLSLLNQRQVGVCRAATAPASRQHTFTVQRLSSTVIAHSAAVSAAESAAGQDQSPLVGREEFDPFLISFVYVTGTVQSVKVVRGAETWVKLVLKVAVPGTDGYLDWCCLGQKDLAAAAADAIKEGMMVRADGQLLQPASLKKLGWDVAISCPAIFLDYVHIIQDVSPERRLERVVLPVMEQQDLAQLAEGGRQLAEAGRQEAAAPRAQPHPQPPAPASAPIEAPGMPQEAADEVEALWMSLFRENHLWKDQRATKTGRQPDFKMIKKPEGATRDALWLDGRSPKWVRQSLHLLPGGVFLPPFIPPEALQGPAKEQAWVRVFTSYNDFWDNRLNKLKPKAPDFKEKEGGMDAMALWITDSATPDWVHDNLDKLPPAPPPKQPATQ